MTDPVSDMLTRVRNALLVKKPTVALPYSKLKFEITKVLEQEGYLKSFTKEREGQRDLLVLKLKYYQGKSVIQGIESVSKPGQRIYFHAQKFPSVLRGLGILIVSTPKGVMTAHLAKKQKVGGEVLAKVW